MMEFTISRVAVCACGAMLIMFTYVAVGGLYDIDVSHMDDASAERIAYMLDVFNASDVDTIVLDGTRILPEGYSLKVHDNFVELRGDKGVSIAVTSFDQELELYWNEAKEISRRTSLRSCGRFL